MSEEPKCFWTAPFADWRLRLAWFAAVAALAGLLAYDLAEETGRRVLCAVLLGTAVLFLAALGRWVFCRRNASQALLVASIVTGIWFLAGFVRWCGSWRNLRKVLWLAGSLVALLVLLRTEEDFRGKLAWESFKRKQRGLALPFTLASLAPPPVPEEQNFALSPIVSSCYGRTLDREGAVKGMQPPPKGQVNRMHMPLDDGNLPKDALGRWENGESCNLERLQRYYWDLAARTNLFAIPVQPRSAAKDVLLALSKYDAALEDLRRAATRPHSRFPVDYGETNPANLKLPHLAACRSPVQLLRLRALAELQDGQSNQALDDVFLALRLAESLGSEPLLLSQMVRAGLFNLALQPVFEGLAQQRWSGAQLEALAAHLASPDFLAAYHLGLRGEMALVADALEFLRQHREIAFVKDNFTRLSASRRLLSRVVLPDGYFYQNALAIERLHLRCSFRAVDAQHQLVIPALASEKTLAAGLDCLSPYNRFARLLLPMRGQLVRRFALAQSNANLARVAVALERYRLARGEYPDTLASLAPEFIASVPHDIMNGQPLRYCRQEHELFTLYSVGWNQTDDGGTVVLNKTGESVDPEAGDWVWRYASR